MLKELGRSDLTQDVTRVMNWTKALYRSGGLSSDVRSGSADARFEGEYQSMRSAPCASEPSHTLHAMPPRITRNSYRPRASDRTMVDRKAVFACRSFELDGSGTIRQGTLREWENKPRLLRETQARVGWISRNKSRLRSRRNFFLESLFIELIEQFCDARHIESGRSRLLSPHESCRLHQGQVGKGPGNEGPRAARSGEQRSRHPGLCRFRKSARLAHQRDNGQGWTSPAM